MNVIEGMTDKTRGITVAVIPVVLVFAASAFILALLNGIPERLQSPPVQTFTSIEEAAQAWDGHILVPAYFPETLQWPAAEIKSFNAEQPFVFMHFTGRDSGLYLDLFHFNSNEMSDESVLQASGIILWRELPGFGRKAFFHITYSDGRSARAAIVRQKSGVVLLVTNLRENEIARMAETLR